MAQKIRQSLLVIVVTMVVIGGAAGIVGALITSNYIQPAYIPYTVDSSISSSSGSTDTIPELRRMERFLGIEQDFEVQNAFQRFAPVVVGVYRQVAQTPYGLAVATPENLVSLGFILTNDGWIVVPADSVDSSTTLAIIHNNRQYSYSDILVDESTNLAFVKTDIRDAAVALLGDSDDLRSGQIVLGVSDYGDVVIGETMNSNFHPRAVADLQTTSERYNEYITVNIENNALISGMPLANLGGEIVGIAVTQGSDEEPQIIPINQIKDITTSVLRDAVVARPRLGVQYVDLYHGIVTSDTAEVQGAQIVARPAAGTPAAIAGLAIGDVITKVDNRPLTVQRSLSEILQEYQPGDTVTLQFIRNDEVVTVDVVLDTVATE